jgi:hypothetical protein
MNLLILKTNKMVAVELYINFDNDNVIEIEREDSEHWIWIYWNKKFYENNNYYRGGKITKETDKIIKYRLFKKNGKSSIKKISKQKFSGYAST